VSRTIRTYTSDGVGTFAAWLFAIGRQALMEHYRVQWRASQGGEPARVPGRALSGGDRQAATQATGLLDLPVLLRAVDH
jgi:DNA-directed RNA polymerase specialized sigma24 family protein